MIGSAGGLPWHIPEDFRLFKQTTSGHAMIMGRKTFESIGRPLPGRLSLVVTRDPSWSAEGVIRCDSVYEALAHCDRERATWGDEVFIIGGGQIFADTIGITDKIYYTDIDLEVAGDTFYPPITEASFSLAHSQPSTGTTPFVWRIFARRTSSIAP